MGRRRPRRSILETLMTSAFPPYRRFRAATVLLLVGGVIVSMLPSDGFAQEVRQRRTLMDWLFGGPKRQQPDVIEIPARKKPKTRKRNNSSIIDLKSNTPPPVKAADARHVLVIGDFLAAGLSEGLQEAFRMDPMTVIDTTTSTASGLVRDDYYNWPESLKKTLKDNHPAAVVIMLGANDRQQMRVNGNKEKFDTPAWNTEYATRVAAMMRIVKDAHTPLVWVGLPAFKNSTTSTAALQFNTVYRTEAERVGGEFVDVWDGFVDENGKFIVSGSDMNGQPARLRTSDGVGMTAAGKRKMAFFAEKPIRKLLGDPLTVEKLIRLDSDNLTQPATQAAAKAGPPTRTPPISLTDPELDGGSALLGAPGTKPITSGTVFSTLREQPPAGRVDDYRLPAL